MRDTTTEGKIELSAPSKADGCSSKAGEDKSRCRREDEQNTQKPNSDKKWNRKLKSKAAQKSRQKRIQKQQVNEEDDQVLFRKFISGELKLRDGTPTSISHLTGNFDPSALGDRKPNFRKYTEEASRRELISEFKAYNTPVRSPKNALAGAVYYKCPFQCGHTLALVADGYGVCKNTKGIENDNDPVNLFIVCSQCFREYSESGSRNVFSFLHERGKKLLPLILQKFVHHN